MRMAAIRPASLDAQIDGEGVGSYAEAVADERAESPYEKLDGKARTVMVREIVQTLDEREQVILRLRFGLEGDLAKDTRRDWTGAWPFERTRAPTAKCRPEEGPPQDQQPGE